MTNQPWPSEWMRGVLSLAVLRVLAEGPTYPGAVPTFTAYQADVRQLEMDEHGLRIATRSGAGRRRRGWRRHRHR